MVRRRRRRRRSKRDRSLERESDQESRFLRGGEVLGIVSPKTNKRTKKLVTS